MTAPRLARLRPAFIRRLAANTGLDGYTVAAMVDHADSRGPVSPHWETVTDAVRQVLQSWSDATSRAAEELQPLGDRFFALGHSGSGGRDG